MPLPPVQSARPSEVPRPGLAARIHEAFGETGILSKSPDFEYRPQQQEMAVGVARALESGKPYVVEAGTGVGKSLAYLLPSVIHAVEKGRKALISTHTINLQEQLISKDIPIIQSLFKNQPINAVLLKGRQNYLCPRRLERAMQQSHDLFTTPEAEELKAIWRWSKQTNGGTLSELDFTPDMKVWHQVCSEPHACTARGCAPRGDCFYQEARKKVAEAHVVVLNHTLFFTLLGTIDDVGLEGEGFLYPNDFLIIDEAHTLENVAARQLGLNLSHSSLRFAIHRLYNPKSRKGLFTANMDAEGVQLTVGLLEALDDFYREVGDAVTFRGPAREFRVREPGLVEHTAAGAMLAVQQRIAKLCDTMENEAAKAEIAEAGRRLGEVRRGIQQFLDMDLDGHVYWVEKSTNGQFESLGLHTAPIDVAEELKRILFGPKRTCVLTSATLGVGEPDLRYFRRRVGADDVEGTRIGSPFDYQRQMKLHLVNKMADPGSPGYEDEMEHWIRHFLTMSQGRAFVLFTSYSLLGSMAGRLEGFCAKKGWELLVQGRGKPRHQIIKEFRDNISSVLFGTESFWTGVDVPGEALSNVIITRLPFAVPDHPLTASRLEAIEEKGGNPFMEYSVPEAILKLRQGVGRLIRTQRDHGIAVILDPRVLTKQYGKAFLEALPDCPREIVNEVPARGRR